VRALKEVLHKFQVFFVKLLYGEVYGTEVVEKSQIPPKIQWPG
jgi:hypothetical protein